MEPFLAEIIMFGGNFAPRGWALCDGQILPIAQNQALFSLLGTIYGGDGRTSFGLPDLRGPHDNIQPFQAVNYIIALQGIFPSRN
ncbi:MAG: tail fiber protein [Flavobacteriaceae bacterium]|nr:tail fiber protein [Flavobacteriaceae bacterium]